MTARAHEAMSTAPSTSAPSAPQPTTSSSGRRLRVLAVPLYKGCWLMYGQAPQQQEEQQQLDWRSARSPPEALALLGKAVTTKVNTDFKRWWKSLQYTEKGNWWSSWWYYVYLGGQWVLSKEDPTETFFKRLPKDTTRVEVLYPASWSEASLRKHLRYTAQKNSTLHRRKILGWGLATLPQSPLILTPLPNVTLYYAAYRFFSHLQAMQGANAMRAGLERQDALQLQHWYRQVASGQVDAARQHRHWWWPLSWLGHPSKRLSAREHEDLARRLEAHEGGTQGPVVVFQPSPLLDTLTQPQQRWQAPLSEEAVARVSEAFGADDLKVLYTRARNREFKK